MEYSSCSSDADYSEIRTETNESTTNYVVDVDGKTAATALRRYDAISNLRSILHDTFKKKSLSVGHLDVNRWRSNLPDKNIPQFTSLFMPICSSTPLNISLESLTTILANEETKNFNRILRRHLSVPKFPPPPPPLEQKANSTFIVMENDDFALWEVEVPRSCSDSDDKDTSAEKDMIQLAEYSCDVNLNESFIEEVTFYVDDLPSSNVIMDRILTIKDVYTMEQLRNVFTTAKSLWLRVTGRPGWCRCRICRDRVLSKMDPIFFTEDAKEFQKRLRRFTKKHKFVLSSVRDEKPSGKRKTTSGVQTKKQVVTTGSQTEIDVHGSPMPILNDTNPEPFITSPVSDDASFYTPKIKRSVHFADPLHHERYPDSFTTTLTFDSFCSSKLTESEKDLSNQGVINTTHEDKCIHILSSLDQILEQNSASCELDGEEEELDTAGDPSCIDESDLYEVHPMMKFPQPAACLYHDSDSMNSYGTITSQELLEVFQNAKEKATVGSLSQLDHSRPSCFDDDYTYTDLIYVSHSSKI
ncbi:hypothetical protein Q1695_010664 [Nippostrongylus brasiliensis]|nr:hypothetical protein Q1695_010664 [Nippostrongylus brasiliensis]